MPNITALIRLLSILFTIIYAFTLGGIVEFMCRYLFFAYTRKDIELPGVVKLLLIEEVANPYFPKIHTYILMMFIPVLLLLCLLLWSSIKANLKSSINAAILICNMTITLIFTTYAYVFFYCIYIFSVPELLDPPVCSSFASIVIKYIFSILFLALIFFFAWFIVSKYFHKKGNL